MGGAGQAIGDQQELRRATWTLQLQVEPCRAPTSRWSARRSAVCWGLVRAEARRSPGVSPLPLGVSQGAGGTCMVPLAPRPLPRRGTSGRCGNENLSAFGKLEGEASCRGRRGPLASGMGSGHRLAGFVKQSRRGRLLRSMSDSSPAPGLLKVLYSTTICTSRRIKQSSRHQTETEPGTHAPCSLVPSIRTHHQHMGIGGGGGVSGTPSLNCGPTRRTDKALQLSDCQCLPSLGEHP